MNYNEAVNYIHSLERFGIMPGLSRIAQLCEKLGNPQNDLKVIHVAGTNGKGSTATIIAEILISAGYNVGLYTSPYVIEFRERIKFNGEMIAPEELASCIEEVKSVIDDNKIRITEFEAVTAVAFLYYSRKKCDYVVLEVGLGGRFDATNIVKKPLACVITHISLDHTQVLGDTLEEITNEKCGILKENTKVVTYPFQEEIANKTIDMNCFDKSLTRTVPNIKELKVTERSIKGTKAVYKNIPFELQLAGEHMVYNCITAIETVKQVFPAIDNSHIAEGISNVRIPARLEIFEHNNAITILDGGHNEDCAMAVKEFLLSYCRNKRIIAVTSLMADKDYDAYLSTVLPLVDILIVTKANVPRALVTDKLAGTAKKYCNNVIAEEKSIDAVKKAYRIGEKNDIVLICGSFYLAGEVRKYLSEMNDND